MGKYTDMARSDLQIKSPQFSDQPIFKKENSYTQKVRELIDRNKTDISTPTRTTVPSTSKPATANRVISPMGARGISLPTMARATADIQKNKTSTSETIFKNLLAGLPDTASNTINALYRMPVKGFQTLADKILPGDQSYSDDGWENRFVTGQRSLAEKTVDSIKHKENMTEIQKILGGAARAMPGIAQGVLGGVGVNSASKLLAASRFVPVGQSANALQPLLNMTPFGASAAGSYASEAEAEGASYTEQALYGIAGGLAEMGTELPVVQGIMKFAGIAKRVPEIENGAKNLLQYFGKAGVEWFKNVAKETLQEAAIGPITGTAKKNIYKSDMPVYGKDGVIDPAQMANDAKVGFAMSLMLTALGMPVSSMAHARAVSAITTNQKMDDALIKQLSKDIQAETPSLSDVKQTEGQQVNTEIVGQDNNAESLINSGVEGEQGTVPEEVVTEENKQATEGKIEDNADQTLNTSQKEETNTDNNIETQKGEETNVDTVQGRVEPEHERAVARLEQRLIEETEGGIPEGTKLYDIVADDAETTVGREIARLLGHDLVHISTKNGLDSEVAEYANRFNGTIYNDTVYVNKDRTNPAHAVAGHEITHSIVDDAEIGKPFLKALRELLDDNGVTHLNKIRDLYKKDNPRLTDAQAEELAMKEFAGDFIGEQMTNKKFWNKLSEKVPDAVAKAIEVIKKMIKGLKGKVSKNNQAKQYITDLERALDYATDAYALYLEKQLAKKAELNQEEKDIIADLKRQGKTLNSAKRNTDFVMNLMVEEHVEYLEKSSGKGVTQGTVTFTEEGDFASKVPRISNNPKWYQDFYKDNGRAPGKGELKELAVEYLKNGFDDFTMSIPPNENYLELEGLKNVYEGIEEKITAGMEKKLPDSGHKEAAKDSQAVNFQIKGKGKMTDSTIGDIYYRGTNPNETKRIRTGNDVWDNNLFVTDNIKSAKAYGSQIETVAFKKGAKILKEGTTEFNKIMGRAKKGQKLLEWASSGIQKAKSAGYDAVHFNSQTDFGTVVMNQDAVIRNYTVHKVSFQLKSPAFQKWFGDSKVVDKNGEPLILYHGTTRNFSQFTKGDIGFHFGTKTQARSRVGRGKGTTIMGVFLSIKKPVTIDSDMGSWEGNYTLLDRLKEEGILNDQEVKEVKSVPRFWEDGYNSNANKKLREILLSKGYDGIRYLNQFEGGTKDAYSYIAFSPTQIKSVNNQGTFDAENPDIRFQLKPTSKGNWSWLKERGFSENVRTDENMNDNLRKMFDEDPEMYEVLSNKKTLDKAQAIFDQGFDQAYAEWNKNIGSFRPEDVPLARLLANHAAKQGKYDIARQIIADIAEKLTMAGQFSQAANILRKADGKTNVITIQRMIDKLNKEGKKLYGNKWNDITLTDDEIKAFNEAKTEEEKEKAKEDIAKRIATQMPVSKTEKFDAWRRIAMLFNPTTHVRNVIGNVIMGAMETTSDTIGAGVEAALQKAGMLKQEQRTKTIGWKKDKDLLKLVKEDWEKMKKDLVNIGKYDIENLNFLNHQKPIFKTQWLEALNSMTNAALNKGDVPFMRRAYINALGSFVKSNGMTKITDEARAYAKRRTLEATYKQPNTLSKFLVGIKRKHKVGGKFLDAAVPFVTTPSNIALRAFDYSPLGLMRTLFMKGKPPEEIIESLCRGLTGSAIVALGFLLASLGWARAGQKKSYKAEELLRESGDQPYSISTAQGSYTFDWAQPFAVPFAMGMVLFEKLDSTDKVDVDSMKDALAAGGDTIFSMSMLQGIKEVLGGAWGSPVESIMGLPASYIQQAWPTIFGKLARIIDPVRRNTYGETDFERFKNQWLAKTPGASDSVQPKLDMFGREQEQAGAFEQLFSPGYYKKETDDQILKEIHRLYKSTRETDFIPKLAPYKFTNDGKEIKLSPEEITEFQRVMGQANYDDIYDLIGTKRYSGYDDQKKAKALRKIVEDNYDKAKESFLEEKGE